MSNAIHKSLWQSIKSTLTDRMPSWPERIESFGQVQAVRDRNAGKRWSDDEVQFGLLKGVLSNQTDWARIERVLPELGEIFLDFSMSAYSALSEAYIDEVVIPWFQARKAGSMTLARDLKKLIQTSGILATWSAEWGSAETRLLSIYQDVGQDPKQLALKLGTPGSHKLPALGVPIAAEVLRNLGFDLAKPDRHILRAAGCFKLVNFPRWADRTGNKAPTANKGELLSTMAAIEVFAASVEEYTSFVDNAIWLACARSGLRLSNSELAALGSIAGRA